MSGARPKPPGPGQPGTGQPGTGELARQVLDRTIALCGIPAPPRHEQQRAEVIRDWWTADGLDAVAVDPAGNVRARLRAGDPGRPAVLLCAHLDTVFGPEITHAVVRHGGRLSGPGVGDNTVAVCALGALDALLPGDLRHPVWIVATTGEEGLGNLAGVRALLDDPPGPVRALIALEGNYLGRVNVTGVGSTRWRVTVTGPGGHAWEEAGQPSAVHEAARLITALASLARPEPSQPDPGQPHREPAQPDPGQPDPGQPDPGQPDPGQPDPGQPDPGQPHREPAQPDPAQPDPGQPDPGQPDPGQPHREPAQPDPGQPHREPARPDPGQPALTQPKTTVNVGLIEGGESVNSRAQRAGFLVDLRSGDPAALDALRAAARAVLDDPAVPLAVSVHAIGERPAGQLDPDHPLATLAAQVLREAGITPRLTAASTDANAAYPRGIPALTLGITTGEGTHTEQEWIDAGPVAAGLAALAATVARLDEQEW